MSAPSPMERLLDLVTAAATIGHDDDRPVTDEETRRAEGLQHAHTPGEVSADPSPASAPSPGHLAHIPDSELLSMAASAVFTLAARPGISSRQVDYLADLGDELVDRAAQFAALESLDTQ